MKTHHFEHVLFYVRDLEWSLMFYCDLLGFKKISRIFDGKAAVLTSGHSHQELLLIEASADPMVFPGWKLGLYRIEIKFGDCLDELLVMRRQLEEAGVSIIGMIDHNTRHSLYLVDPDGNEVELYATIDAMMART
jgi:catechol 2,3-dioxygenase